MDPDELDNLVDGPIAPLKLPRRYDHVLKAVHERPWALTPAVLGLMTELIDFRAHGGRLSAGEIEERIAAAKAQNGDRLGGALVGNVAVLPLYGLITQRSGLMSDMSGGTSVEDVRDALRAALDDPSVSAIVFDIDSPGGSVDGIPELAAEIRSVRNGPKPIVAQIDTLCASAAYWLAAQMTEIVITPSGEVGSIGVYAGHQDMTKAEEMAGVKTTLISAGPYKTEGSPVVPLTDEALAAAQDRVDTFYGMFLADVAKGRGVTSTTVATTYGQGRTLLAEKALAAGMVDRVGTLEATIRRYQASAPRTSRAARAAAAPTPLPAAGTPTPQIAAVAAVPFVPPDPAWNQRMKGRKNR